MGFFFGYYYCTSHVFRKRIISSQDLTYKMKVKMSLQMSLQMSAKLG